MASLLYASRSLPDGDRLRRSPGLVFQAFDEAVHDVPQLRLTLQVVTIFQSFSQAARRQTTSRKALVAGFSTV